MQIYCYYSSCHRFGFPVLSDGFPMLRSYLAVQTAVQIIRPTTVLPVFSDGFPVLQSYLAVQTAVQIIRPTTGLPVLSKGFPMLSSIQSHRVGFPILSDGFPVLFSIQNHLVFPTVSIQPSSFHSFRLTASQIVHLTTCGELANFFILSFRELVLN